jgi:hypothetical protein
VDCLIADAEGPARIAAFQNARWENSGTFTSFTAASPASVLGSGWRQTGMSVCKRRGSGSHRERTAAENTLTGQSLVDTEGHACLS